MAPDSGFCKHQLGKPKSAVRNGLVKIVLFLPLTLIFLSTSVEARTKPKKDLWQVFPAGHSHKGRSIPQQLEGALSFAPSPDASRLSPPGPTWSNKIHLSIPDHSAIQRYIRFYREEGRKTFARSFERSWPYLPLMTEILNSHGVPGELIAVAMIESSFKPGASYRGAVGFWQFMAPTARYMGLRVDQWVDERNDPIKSTDAAARYLKLLHEQFGSWPLALAAYNAGRGTVSNALKSRNAKTFWQIGKGGALPKITRQYVPKVLATASILRDLERHGFERPERFPVYDVVPVAVETPLRLDQGARWLEMPLKELKALNPALRLDRLPPDCGVELHLPSSVRGRFELAYNRFVRE